MGAQRVVTGPEDQINDLERQKVESEKNYEKNVQGRLNELLKFKKDNNRSKKRISLENMPLLNWSLLRLFLAKIFNYLNFPFVST